MSIDHVQVVARMRRWFANASTRSCRIHTDLPDPA